jgi:hypothetical protein
MGVNREARGVGALFISERGVDVWAKSVWARWGLMEGSGWSRRTVGV